ncbi:MAG: trypsin-like peptidase domain-containing protein, partial [Planctomycetota bacterium]|nr:trypsin-like peptidase domain-containing protein [Planctomycetota bacterium]
MFLSNKSLGKPVFNLLSLILVFTFAFPAFAQPEPGDERAVDISVNAKLKGFFSGDAPTSVDQIELIQAHVQSLAEKVQKTVVGIGVGAAQGSGVIISRDGYVLTAAHVSGKPGMNARLFLADGRVVPARTLGLNRTFDAGLMKIIAEDWEDQNWPHADMGVSGDVVLGQWVMAVGHPGGFQVDRNPVVRLGRIVHTYQDVLTSDCTLIGGDSGGPLFSMDGRVVGIHSRIGPELSHNVHAPIDSFKEGWERMANEEQWGNNPGAPLIGVRGGQNEDTAEIDSIIPGSPAAKAGIKRGDVIIQFAGKDITTFDSLVNVVAVHRPGEKVILKVLRKDKELELELTVGRAGPPIPQAEEDSSLSEQPITTDYNSWMSYIASYKPATVHQRNYETIVNAFAPVVNKAGNSTIKISDGKRQLALGVVVSADGYILTKASEILSDELEFPLSCEDGRGNTFEATFVSHRPKFDLLMLKGDARKLKPIKWNIEEQPLGSWLISPSISENPMAIGVVSAHPRSIRGGLLGVFLGETPAGVRVEQVFPNTAAARAKMRRG